MDSKEEEEREREKRGRGREERRETQELTGAKRQHERRREEERSHKTMTTTTRKLARNVVRTVTVSVCGIKLRRDPSLSSLLSSPLLSIFFVLHPFSPVCSSSPQVSKASPAQLSRGKAVRLISKQRTRTWSTTVRAEGNDNSDIDVEPKVCPGVTISKIDSASALKCASRFLSTDWLDSYFLQLYDFGDEQELSEADKLRAAERFMVIDQGLAECSGCGYMYDNKKGDPEYPIASGVTFSVSS